MPVVDFTSNPFTVLSAPSGGSITPQFDSGEGLQTLQFSPGSWQLFLPLSHASDQGVDDWYGTVRLYSDGAAVGINCQLLDDTHDYGSDANTLFPLAPPAPHWGGPFNIGTHDTDPGLTGFLSGGPLPASDAIASGFGLVVHISGDFGAQFAMGALDLTVVTSIRSGGGGGGGTVTAEFDDSLSISDTLRVELVDRSTAPPAGTGQPKRFSDGAFLDSCDPTDARATVCTRTTRGFPADLAAHLQGETLTLAYCLRLVRRDGTMLGFTTFDRDLAFGGITYEASNSVNLAALRQELGAVVGNTDISGFIRSDRVTEADILAGRYDGAELTFYLVNWADCRADNVGVLARGWWGAVTLVDGAWKAEYRSLSQRLQQQSGVELTSPTCRVERFGDARCKFDAATVQFSRTVSGVVDNRNFTFSSDTHASRYYAAGRVEFTSGLNAGLEREVKRHTLSGGAAVIELQEAFPFAVAIGDTATLEAGCDRRAATCSGKFGNMINFRGEPFVPGSDVLKRVQSLQVVG